MKALAFICGLLLLAATTWAGGNYNDTPHPGIGKCPSGQVVNGLIPNAPPQCINNGGGSGTVDNGNTGEPAYYSSTGTVVEGGTLADIGALAISNNLSDVANATTARGNLGAAKSGANTDLTSINDVTSASALPLNGLAAPSANYPMGGFLFTGEGPGVTGTAGSTGEPCVFNQYDCQFNDLGATSVNQVLNPMAPTVLVAGTTSTYLTAGALCNGSHDDTLALQNTIFAACGISSISGSPTSAEHPSIVIPATGHACLHSEPLRIPCSDIVINGAPASQYAQSGFGQNYDGATLNIESYNLANLTFDSNVGMTGNSLHLYNYNTNAKYISLSDYLDTPKLNLNGLANFDVQVVFSVTGLGSNFSNNDYMYEAGNTPLSINSPSHVIYISYGSGSANNLEATWECATSGSVTVTGPSIVAGTTYYAHSVKNGPSVALYVSTSGASTEYGPATCTGNLVQTPWEESNIPAQGSGNYWPDHGDFNESVTSGYNGDNAFTWVSNTARSDAGFPASKPTLDGNTLLLCNWANTQTVDGLQRCENGTQTGSDTPVWFNVKEYAGDATAQLNGGRISNINLNIQPTSGHYGQSDGIFTQWGSNQEFDHDFVPNCNAYGLSFFTYYTKSHDNSFGFNSDFCRSAETTWGSSDEYSGSDSRWGWVGLSGTGLGNIFTEATQDSQGSVQYLPYYFHSYSFVVTGPNTDNESGEANLIAALLYDTGTSGNTNEVINAQQINSSNNAPMIVQNGGDPLKISGGGFNKNGNSPSEVIDITGSAPPYPDIVEGLNLTNASGIPLTNVPQSVIAIGQAGGQAMADTLGFSFVHSAAGTAIPACATAYAHARACVSDSAACTPGTTYISGNSTPCELWCNGTNWIESGSGC